MWSEIKRHYRTGNIIIKLILINVGIFVVQSIIFLFFALAGKKDIFLHFLQHLYFPANLQLFFRQPWSLFTYMFLHDPVDIFHILFNMLWLYVFGRILIEYLPRRNVVPLYFLGGIVGALLYMVTFNLSPAFQNVSVLVGASASILAMVAAAATLMPDYPVMIMFIGAVKLKYIALFVILIDIVSISSGSNEGGHLAHLGGALTGFLYILSYKKGLNWFDALDKPVTGIKNMFSRRPKVAYVNTNPGGQKRPSTPDNQKRTDAILDKISKAGYESLTKEEKEYLFKISNDKK